MGKAACSNASDSCSNIPEPVFESRRKNVQMFPDICSSSTGFLFKYFGFLVQMRPDYAGGSNGYRVYLWKVKLQELANRLNKKITVLHFPPGTSKWNKIEHRLFSFISKNWRGKPLISAAVIINLISATRTDTGLTVECVLDNNTYRTKIKGNRSQRFGQIYVIRK